MRVGVSMLFSERSIWTMVHGIGLGGGALIGLAAALFYVYAARSSDNVTAPPGSGALAGATVLSANRWKAREIAPGRVGAVTLILMALGVLGTFPPVWALL